MIKLLRKLLGFSQGSTGKREISVFNWAVAVALVLFHFEGLDSSDKADLLFWIYTYGIVMLIGAFGFHQLLQSPVLMSLIDRNPKPKKADDNDFNYPDPPLFRRVAVLLLILAFYEGVPGVNKIPYIRLVPVIGETADWFVAGRVGREFQKGEEGQRFREEIARKNRELARQRMIVAEQAKTTGTSRNRSAACFCACCGGGKT